MARWMADSKKLNGGSALEIRRANLAHIRDIMAEHVLYAHLERGSRAGTSLAGTTHLQCHDTVVKSLKHDVAAILGHGRADPHGPRSLGAVPGSAVGVARREDRVARRSRPGLAPRRLARRRLEKPRKPTKRRRVGGPLDVWLALERRFRGRLGAWRDPKGATECRKKRPKASEWTPQARKSMPSGPWTLKKLNL